VATDAAQFFSVKGMHILVDGTHQSAVSVKVEFQEHRCSTCGMKFENDESWIQHQAAHLVWQGFRGGNAVMFVRVWAKNGLTFSHFRTTRVLFE
jgi:hypothetical protein